MKRVKIIGANGKVYDLIDPSTKPLDPKLKAESEIRAQSIIDGMKWAAAEAERRGVPLRDILPVS